MGNSSSRARLKARRDSGIRRDSSSSSSRNLRKQGSRAKKHNAAPPSHPDDDEDAHFSAHPPPAKPTPRPPPGRKGDHGSSHNIGLVVDGESAPRKTSANRMARPPPMTDEHRKRLESEGPRSPPPKPRPESLVKAKSVVARPPPGAYPPPLTMKQSKILDDMMLDELPDLDEMDQTQMYDPWSAVADAHRLIFQGEGNGSHVCMKCHMEIFPSGTEMNSLPRVFGCPECAHVTTQLLSNRVRLNEDGASDSDWAIYADEDGFLKWKRVFTVQEEETILAEEKRLSKLDDEQLHKELEKYGADVSHYSAIQDNDSLVQTVLAFYNWGKGKSPIEGYVRDFNKGTLRWQPVGKIRLDPIQSASQLRIVADELYETSLKPFWYRLAWFKQQLGRLRIQSDEGPLGIRLRRDHILEDSSNFLLSMTGKQLWRSTKYEFMGEPGMDSGGVSREWFSEVSNQIFAGGFGLFEYLGDTEGRYRINTNSGVVNELHLQYFRFAGRLLGKALFENCSINGHLTKDLYKMMIGIPLSLRDLRYVDPQIWRSVNQIMECEDVSVLALDFTYTNHAFGAVEEVELKEGGSKIDVTNDNVHEYLQLLLEHIVFGRTQGQLSAMLTGIYDVVPHALLQVFSASELELVMCGQSKIDVKDWKANTTYRGEFKEKGESHPDIVWFWDIVENLSEDEKGNLVRFCTGTPRVPVQGFSGLQGGSGMLLFNIESISKSMSVFPRAHTCFNRLELPLYDNKEEMKRFLTEAIKIESGFNLE